MSKFSAAVYGLFFALNGLLCYLAHRLPYFPGDIAISRWLQGINLPSLNPIMLANSYITSVIPATVIVILVVGGLCALMGIITAAEVIPLIMPQFTWMFWFVLSAILILASIALSFGRGYE